MADESAESPPEGQGGAVALLQGAVQELRADLEEVLWLLLTHTGLEASIRAVAAEVGPSGRWQQSMVIGPVCDEVYQHIHQHIYQHKRLSTSILTEW